MAAAEGRGGVELRLGALRRLGSLVVLGVGFAMDPIAFGNEGFARSRTAGPRLPQRL